MGWPVRFKLHKLSRPWSIEPVHRHYRWRRRGRVKAAPAAPPRDPLASSDAVGHPAECPIWVTARYHSVRVLTLSEAILPLC
ncbi:hypothetical protein EVAR_52047_1 [Eumeta japonica]|uniref:Uncharacterized protein n=1 Tax=Eumeta variegata TaxID=151549 RepID=A0A4C1Z3Q3_EUMVA|nr:hypothetical protein EVAR_52047_1 [Eumeta japonica]